MLAWHGAGRRPFGQDCPDRRQAIRYGMPVQVADDTSLEFDCPRCKRAVHERFYGPCGSCRTELGSMLRGEAHAVEDVAFVSKMHVTPNFVATKD